jgi:hypothetical protein
MAVPRCPPKSAATSKPLLILLRPFCCDLVLWLWAVVGVDVDAGVCVDTARMRRVVDRMILCTRKVKVLQAWFREQVQAKARSSALKAAAAAAKIQAIVRGAQARTTTNWLRYYARQARTIQRVYRCVIGTVWVGRCVVDDGGGGGGGVAWQPALAAPSGVILLVCASIAWGPCVRE